MCLHPLTLHCITYLFIAHFETVLGFLKFNDSACQCFKVSCFFLGSCS